MSVQSEILRIQHNVANTYAKVAEKGGTVPAQPNSANLAAAVATIPEGGDAYLVRAPIGTIVAWSGTVENIPTGWHLCNGEDGTLDLRDKFILGAGTHPVGETGGSETVTLTEAQMPEHGHGIIDVGLPGDSACSAFSGHTPGFGFENVIDADVSGISTAGSSQPHPNMPPYYTLCWIQKVTADPADGLTQEEADERYLKLSGGTMAGTLYLQEKTGTSYPIIKSNIKGTKSARAVFNLFSVRSYGTGAGIYLTLDDGTTEIGVGIEDAILRGVAAPKYISDAANKKYVDDAIAALVARIAALEAEQTS